MAFDALASKAVHWAMPDSLGVCRMFLCRALVGEYHTGYEGCLLPDAKAGLGFYVHESVVNSAARPTKFVLFQDDQAYPEYVVMFKRAELSKEQLKSELVGVDDSGLGEENKLRVRNEQQAEELKR